MDQLRTRAFMDILPGIDSPGQRPGRRDEPPAPAGPPAGVIPPGFAGLVTRTIPAITLTGLADRPGEQAGIGPIDPKPGANTQDRYQTGHRPTAPTSLPDRASADGPNWDANMLLCAPLLTCLPR